MELSLLLKKTAWPLYLLMVGVVATVVVLYGCFFDNPLVFDDLGFFGTAHPDYLNPRHGLTLRWLAYASLEWMRPEDGESLVWLRAGNLALHLANGILLGVFVYRLFVSLQEDAHGKLFVLAVWGSAWFLLNPAATYGVAYLVQRTILMATLFSLVTALLFLEGVRRNQLRWMWAGVASYALACLSKEHAVMLPAVILALLVLLQRTRHLQQPGGLQLRQIAPVFIGFAVVGMFIVFQSASGNVIAHAYEPNGVRMLQGIDPRLYHPLSIMTQGHLFWNYIGLWLVPDPAWMAIDIREDFAPRIFTWPHSVGFAGFLLYGVGAVWLLLKREQWRLLGFALLCPWMMFATELATVRIQEIFVIYRSYLWMPWLAIALVMFLRFLALRHVVALMLVVLTLMAGLTWQRLTVLSDPLVLWDESWQRAQRAKHPQGLGRILHNRGLAYLNTGRHSEAIADFSRGIGYLPTYSALYNDRAVAYLQTGQYALALRDYHIAIQLDSSYYNPFLGRAKVFEALGEMERARRDYAVACRLGVDEVCEPPR